MKTARVERRGFSIVELVLAVVVLALLAAVAIPRLSQAAPNSDARDLRASLAVLRTAIELYHQDHGRYPGQRPAGSAGAGTAAAFIHQLTQYSDADGHASITRSETFCYGPYLRRGIPLCPVAPAGPSARVHVITGGAVPAHDPTAGGAGWIYNPDTGYIAANSNDVDADDVRYDTY